MADTNNLPKGTNTTISGSGGDTGKIGGTGLGISSPASDNTDSLIRSGEDADSGNKASGVLGMVSSATGKVADEAGTRAKSFLSQGLERSSETLNNISTLIGDTVEQIEEKLGPQYGGYARTASETLTRYADRIAKKDPDELVDDARDVIRKSPSIALGAAAILGFGLIRLVKAGADGVTTGTRTTPATPSAAPLATPKKLDI